MKPNQQTSKQKGQPRKVKRYYYASSSQQKRNSKSTSSTFFAPSAPVENTKTPVKTAVSTATSSLASNSTTPFNWNVATRVKQPTATTTIATAISSSVEQKVSWCSPIVMGKVTPTESPSTITPTSTEPSIGLTQYFRREFKGKSVLRSSVAMNWTRFWKWVQAEKMRKSPVVVGVDCEGNNQLIPMMVQIATPEFIIIETPKSRTAGLSADLRRLIADRSILKVLCDPGGKDVWSLDLGFWDRSHGMWPSMGWCDIEYMCNMVYGQGKTRGLVGVFNRVQPNVRLAPKVSKDWKLSPVSYFIYRERENKEYIGDERDVPKNVWKYSAADAWITLKAYQHLTQLPRCRPSQYDPPTIALATLTVSSTPPRTDNVSPQSQPSPSSLQQPQHTTPYTVLSILQSQQQLQQQQLYNREYPQIVYNYNVFNQSVARDQQQQHRLRPQPHQQSYTYPRPQRPYQHYNTLYTCHDYNREQAVAAAALHTQNQDNSA